MKAASAVLVALFFVGAGVNHFVHPAFYERIVPPWLPAHHLLVQISGVAEIAGGVAVLVPALRWYAGIWLIALLVAVFPANVYMAVHPQLFARVAAPWMLYARLPLQPLLGLWVWWTCCFV